MSSDDEDGFCRFGTPLDPIEEGYFFIIFTNYRS